MDAAFLTFYGLLHMGNKDYIMLKFPFTKTLMYSKNYKKNQRVQDYYNIRGCQFHSLWS